MNSRDAAKELQQLQQKAFTAVLEAFRAQGTKQLDNQKSIIQNLQDHWDIPDKWVQNETARIQNDPFLSKLAEAQERFIILYCCRIIYLFFN